MFAAQGGHTDCVKELISSGADVNIGNQYGTTALMLKGQEGHTDCAQGIAYCWCRCE